MSITQGRCFQEIFFFSWLSRLRYFRTMIVVICWKRQLWKFQSVWIMSYNFCDFFQIIKTSFSFRMHQNIIFLLLSCFKLLLEKSWINAIKSKIKLKVFLYSYKNTVNDRPCCWSIAFAWLSSTFFFTYCLLLDYPMNSLIFYSLLSNRYFKITLVPAFINLTKAFLRLWCSSFCLSSQVASFEGTFLN